MAKKKTPRSRPSSDAEVSDQDAGVELDAEPDAEPDAELEEMQALLDENLNKLRKASAEAFERLSETATQLAGQARQMFETSEDYVRHHPGVPLLGALALGVVIGVLLGRN